MVDGPIGRVASGLGGGRSTQQRGMRTYLLDSSPNTDMASANRSSPADPARPIRSSMAWIPPLRRSVDCYGPRCPKIASEVDSSPPAPITYGSVCVASSPPFVSGAGGASVPRYRADPSAAQAPTVEFDMCARCAVETDTLTQIIAPKLGLTLRPDGTPPWSPIAHRSYDFQPRPIPCVACARVLTAEDD